MEVEYLKEHMEVQRWKAESANDRTPSKERVQSEEQIL